MESSMAQSPEDLLGVAGPPVCIYTSTMSSESTDAEAGSALETSLSYAERLRRWKERREKRRQKNESGELRYANLAKAAAASNHRTGSLADVLEERGLLIRDLEPIGFGQFARVYSGLWYRNGPKDPSPLQCAVKSIRSSQRFSPVDREAKVGLGVHHENLIHVFQVSVKEFPFVLIMEYCAGGNLHSAMRRCLAGSSCTYPVADSTSEPRKSRLVTWTQRLKVASDVACGMAFLHENGVLHRDLKSHNVMLQYLVEHADSPVVAKIGDFGMAKDIGGGGAKQIHTLDVGSWLHAAPEVFECGERGEKHTYDWKADVYSYSMILYELLTSSLPFQDSESKGMTVSFALQVTRGVRPDLQLIPSDAPDVLRHLMIQSWAADPVARPHFADIVAILSAPDFTRSV
eukprot:TRINITY_DN30316_c0_g2_i1.p1 TRINITY_DN30316_c0_g2~~TRINITY_DN30316_c0_g2_i1.p1  ORF type:complete len:411 (+),score=32.41 TRINITY_DN30316_c0_g2_i1:26-1234(+)